MVLGNHSLLRTPADAECVYHMQDVLAVYTRPYDAARPQVCMDELIIHEK